MDDSSFTCMGNQTGSTSPQIEKVVSAAHGALKGTCGILNVEREKGVNGDQFVGHYEESGGVGPSGFNDEYEAHIGNMDPVTSIREHVAHSDKSKDTERPSFITIRSKRVGKKPTHNAEVNLPDLNIMAENSCNSDPFNIDEIFRLEEQNLGASDEVPLRSVNRDVAGDNWEEEHNRIFLSEVNRTMKFGECLGIGVAGFENHVKKIVSGEMEFASGQ
ncbi:hypothetical protein Hanom_Chr15g01405851 [Helianthus anomalus]